MRINIFVPVLSEDYGNEVVESLKPLPVTKLIGNYNCFSKMINEAIYKSSLKNNEILIICSHRVRPTPDDMDRMVQKIHEGYGMVAFYRLGCFGFKLDLIREIGFFDENFIPAGYEDDDFFFRLQESDIALYEDKSVEYIPGPSLWQQELYDFEGVPYKQPITYKYFIQKWNRDHIKMIINRKILERDVFYKIGDKTGQTVFKKWNESVLLDGNLQKYYTVEKISDICDKTILIFGGSGSLGQQFIEKYSKVEDPKKMNKIHVFSRDENKHWHLSQKPEFKNVNFIIGDIRDYQRVLDTLLTVNPHIIIIASAMKHIDRCEFDVNEALLTNTIGTMNICKTILTYELSLKRLENVVFISTDKATKPINTYGMTKALSEKIMIEYSIKMKTSSIKFNIVRYGNVLNSRGSIIPKLKESKDKIINLTHKDMTRFIMTQQEAVKLIEFAILNGNTGETIIPKLSSMNILELFQLFSEKYDKEINITSIRPGEKLHEELLNEDELRRTYIKKGYYILPSSSTNNTNTITFDDKILETGYSSCDNKLSKEELKTYLEALDLL
jgi:FlaA1/EpsC-like NDP-sugar epimerase